TEYRLLSNGDRTGERVSGRRLTWPPRRQTVALVRARGLTRWPLSPAVQAGCPGVPGCSPHPTRASPHAPAAVPLPPRPARPARIWNLGESETPPVVRTRPFLALLLPAVDACTGPRCPSAWPG